MSDRLEGQCLCGDVTFTTGPVHQLDVCHCSICQRWTGGPFIGADFMNGDVELTKEDGLTWYASSEWARRGFCKTCGSSLFYRLNDVPDFWAICGGSLNLPQDLSINREIFIDHKPDYYALSGSQPKLTGEEFMKTLEAPSDD